MPVGALPADQSRPALVAEVARQLTHLPADATVLVACSGGPDSVALAHLSSEARPDLALVVVYVGHGLRASADEARDRELVTTHGAWLGAEVVLLDVEVVRDGHGTEAAARDARYAALRDVAGARGAAAILVGHTADDQAETVLLRLARGTGTDGLAGMAVHGDGLLRPLLRLRRSDTHAFVAGDGLPIADDATNRDPAIRRVRVRTEVIPALERLGHDPVATLSRLADLARDDRAALTAATDALPDAIRFHGPVVVLREEVLHTAPVALARRLARRACAHLLATAPSAATVGRILGAAPGTSETLPGGIELQVDGAWRTLAPTPRPDPGRGAVRLSTPGRLTWDAAGLVLKVVVPGADDGRAELVPAAGGDQIAFALPGLWSPPRQRLDAGRLAPGTDPSRYAIVLPDLLGDRNLRGGHDLEVRTLVPGDRLRGPGGTRRVVELFRDAGVPRALRSRWPLVVSAGRVLWIPGIAVDGEALAAGRRAPAAAIQASPAPPLAGGHA